MKNCFTLFDNDGITNTLSKRNKSVIGNSILTKLTLLMMLCFAAFNSINAQYCTMACHNQVNVSMGSNCEIEIAYDLMMPDGDNPALCSPNGPQAYMVFITYPAGTTTFDPPNIIDASHVGYNLEVMVKHWATGNTCWGNVLVEDKSAPQITCPADVVINCSDPLPNANISNSNIFDCSSTTQSYSDNVVDLGCNGTYSSQIIRTYSVTDAMGNTATCNQNIYVQRATLADVEPPHNYDGNDYPVLSCGSQYDPSIVPGPTLNGNAIINGGACDILLTHSDQEIDLCGGSKKVFRTWTVVDWCSGANTNMVQIINLIDQTPPSIVCPSNVNFGANSQDCNGSVVFPPATINDNCSNPVDVVITTSVGSITGNGGYLAGIPLGSQTVTYSATDQCDNTSSCTITVDINDNTPPIPVCDQNTVVALSDGDNGTTLVCQQTFDDGSYDNCEIVVREIKRMDSPASVQFDDCVMLSCEDVGTNVMIIFRVADAAGNSNQCMVEVEVQDKALPGLTCPPNKYLECSEDYTNLDLTSEAIGTDNCGAVVTFTDVQTNIDDCGVGFVKRRWRAEDENGNFSVCDQTIYLQNSYPFTGNMIIWPLDPPAVSCVDASTLDPEDLNAPYDQPTYNGDVCDQVFKSHEDKIFYVTNSTCFEIRREWKVVDWCQYDPNSSSTTGIWYHTQTISVTDSEAPVIDGPADILIAATDNSCTSSYVDIPEVTATDCNPDVEITNNSPYATSNNGGDASGNYPYGNTTVTFFASDGCGNVSEHDVVIKITDGKAPTPVCLFGISTDIMSTGMVQLWASDFEAGSSFDNCTAYEDLIITTRIIEDGVPPATTPPTSTSVTFTCEHVGTAQVQVWVGDESGNWDYCQGFVSVQDNFNACGTTPPPENNEYYISGKIANEESDDVEDVEMNISSGSSSPLMTGSDGNYMFPNLTGGTNYTVTPEKDMNHGNGISTFDLIIMQKHILGIQLLDSPYKIIAADVNKSQTISTVDIVELRRLILNQITEFTANTSWRFVDSDFVFANPANPFATEFPEVFSLNSLTTDESAADFVAVKVGDLNCSASPNNMVAALTRNNETMTFGMTTTDLPDDQVMVSFTAKEFNDILGYQFALSFDTESLSFVDMVGGSLPNINTNNFGFSLLNDGIITTSWSTSTSNGMEDGEVLFSLVFDKLQKNLPNGIFNLESNIVNAEAYRQSGTEITPLDVNIAIEDNLSDDQAGNTTTEILSTIHFKLYQNKPNPFDNETVIGFDLPDASNVSIKIYDMSGKVLRMTNADFEAGYNEVTLRKDEIDATGIIYYQVETATNTATNKMVIMR